MFGLITLAGVWVEHLAHATALLAGLHPVEADVVAPAGGGVGQRDVNAQLAPGTAEPVGQSPRSVSVRRRLDITARLFLLLPPLLLSLVSRQAAARPARVPGPDTDPLLVRVVETLRTSGGTPHALQAGVEHVALVWQLAGVDTILAGTVCITWRERGSSFTTILP